MQEKCLLVIGASSDVGMEYIRCYAGQYGKIIGTYFSHEVEINALKCELGEKLVTYRLDLSKEEEVAKFCEFLASEEGKPDCVLHLSARPSEMVRAHEISCEMMRYDLELSAVSFMQIMKQVAPSMVENKFGRVCCVLSSVVKSPVAFQSSYVISKFALLGAMKALAAEYAGKGITVNAVSPSMIDTKFVKDVSDFVKGKKKQTNPMKRLATPNDLLGAIHIFLSDESAYITGENMLIAGGRIIS